MIRKGITTRMASYRYQLVMCQKSFERYESMKYYIAVCIYDIDEKEREKFDGYREGYVVRSSALSRCDYFELEDFNHYFVIVDNCDNDKRISNALYWLRKVRNIKIIIRPAIHLDGYWYEYEFDIYYPFNYMMNRTERGFDNFAIAAKTAIRLAKQACLEVHGKSVTEWLKYVIGK